MPDREFLSRCVETSKTKGTLANAVKKAFVLKSDKPKEIKQHCIEVEGDNLTVGLNWMSEQAQLGIELVFLDPSNYYHNVLPIQQQFQKFITIESMWVGSLVFFKKIDLDKWIVDVSERFNQKLCIREFHDPKDDFHGTRVCKYEVILIE